MIGLGVGASIAAYQASTRSGTLVASAASARGANSPTAQSGNASYSAGQQSGARPIFGSVQKIGENEFTVTTSSGSDPVTVRVNDQTKFSKQVAATLSDIKQGDRITVRGESGTDGTIVSTSIQLISEEQGADGQSRAQRVQSGGQAAGQPNSRSGQGSSAQGAPGLVIGTVEGVADDAITVTKIGDTSGQNATVKVAVSDKTTITKTDAGSVKDLAEGNNVVVTGPRGADGVVVASNVQILSPEASQTAGRGQ